MALGLAMFAKLAALLALGALGIVRAANPNTVRVAILSKIDDDLAVYWINTWNKGLLVRQKEDPITAQGMLNVDSYFGHSFLVIEEQRSAEYSTYEPEVLDPKFMTTFTMGEFDLEAIITRDVDGNLVTTLESALTRTASLMSTASETCKNSPEVRRAAMRRKGLAAAGVESESCSAGGDPDELSPEFMECLTKAIAGDLAKKETEANKSMRMLEQVGDRARNYTCADPLMETTNTSLKTVDWLDPEGGKKYNAKVFLDEPAAKIYLLDDFATDAECKALTSKASAHLQDATVNAGAGKSTLSNARRAKAGGVAADLDNPKSVTAPLYRRGYAFANHVTGYGLTLPGQEGFSVIKYGSNDEYRPHCDGDCTGVEFKPGGRVSTMVIYCEQAEVGGGTTFSSSDVFVNGKKGQAVFFSYLGPDSRTDIGRTRHSGCPILKGTKWIATLWMRKGVTAERGWQYYDPSGMPSAFARTEAGGVLTAADAASVKAQSSAADSENSDAAVDASNPETETVAENQGGDEANDSRADGAASEEGGLLGSLGDKLSSMWGGSTS